MKILIKRKVFIYEKSLNLLEVIEILNRNNDLIFKRINDEKFKIFKGNYGDLMLKLGDIIRPLPVFNYMQDLWILDEDED